MDKTFRSLLPSMMALLLFTPWATYAITEQDFEELVKRENAELNALHQRKEVLKDGAEEADLIYGWQLVGGLNRRLDKGPSTVPNFTYGTLETLSNQIALQKQFSFGLESKIGLNSTQTNITDGNSGGQSFDSRSWFTQPILEMKLPLLSGGFGRKIRADYQSLVLRKRLEALAAENEYDLKLNEAKVLLWSTILQKELLAAQAETLNRIQKIYDIVRVKAAQNLEASSNFLQTRSALEQSELDLKGSELRFAQLERLLKLVLKRYTDLPVPRYDFQKFKKAELKNYAGRVTAIERTLSLSEQSQNQAALSLKEDTRSRLDLVASVSLNGEDEKWRQALNESTKGQYPTNYLGLQWVIPLDQEITTAAYERQVALAKVALTKQKYVQIERSEALLKDLVSQQNQLIDMLALNLRLEKTQSEKLKNERLLLNQGRSSIYQVLQFELDLARAQSGKFQLALDLEKLQQQLSLYRYNSYE